MDSYKCYVFDHKTNEMRKSEPYNLQLEIGKFLFFSRDSGTVRLCPVCLCSKY